MKTMGFKLIFLPAGGEARRPCAVEQGDDGATENGGTAAAKELSPTADDVLAGDDGGVESPLACRSGTPEAHPGTHLSRMISEFYLLSWRFDHIKKTFTGGENNDALGGHPGS